MRPLVQGTLGLVLSAASVFGAPPKPLEAALKPSCDVFVQNTYSMPDGKTYAVALRSRVRETSDLYLRLFSDQSEYGLDLKNVSFEPIQTESNATPSLLVASFIAPLFFVSLPRSDILLGLVAEQRGATAPAANSCLAGLSYTDAYRRADDPNYQPTEAAKADLQELTRLFMASVAPERAVDVPAKPAADANCPVRYRTPATVKVLQPEYPLAARAKRIGGTTMVKIQLDTDDSIVDARIYRSSGNTALDAEALKSARRSEYKAAIFRCHAMSGTYIFRADFIPN
jgi:TonB family protein